jgi:hypothetical protein
MAVAAARSAGFSRTLAGSPHNRTHMISDRRGDAVPTLGFLTVVPHPQHGLFGGYLLLNASGRPLEFHCTAPVKPNRAQEILFGPTLEAYLYGEQIGQSLAAKASHTPLVVLSDVAAMLAVRPFVAQPVVLVLPDAETPRPTDGGGTAFHRVDAAHEPLRGLFTFQCGRNSLALDAAHTDDRAIARDRLAVVAETFNLAEPFGRIRAAIEEAQRGGR